MISLFDIFKIGIGPSSSHTTGPMVAANTFIASLQNHPETIERITVKIYGSLAYTLVGHCTDKAIILGLSGYAPHDIDPDEADVIFNAVVDQQCINTRHQSLPFNY